MPDPKLPAAGTHVSLADVFRYLGVIEEIITVFEGAKALPLGGVQAVPAIKFVAHGYHYTWDQNGLTRTA